jgi:ribosomal-protein-alanine N-acetyltransferase
MFRLEAEDILLREWRPPELPAMHRWLGNPRVTRFLSWGAATLDDSARQLAECLAAEGVVADRRQFFLAIEELSTQRVIGDAGFEWDSAARQPLAGRLGYFLEPEYWGRGIATHAAGLVLRLAFELGASEMRASCDARNRASERVMQKCGLTREPHREREGRREYRISRAQWERSAG